MLSFAVFSNGLAADSVELAGAYLLGTDDVPLRAEITFKDGVIHCNKRAAGPAGLAILWTVPGFGRVMVETVRLVERPQPYILSVELARGRLMRINHKLEDWGMTEHDGTEAMAGKAAAARDLLIQALQAETPAAAAALGDQALATAAIASEELTLFHAEVLLARRKQAGGFGRRVFGCSIALAEAPEGRAKLLEAAVDFVDIPIVWRDIEPREQAFNWKPLDRWIESLAKRRMPMKGSALLSFNESNVPDWLYIWEHDFDTIRDLAYEHARRVINRYSKHIQVWDVISGIHANNCFSFNFEQLMELTRMASAIAKQASPRGLAIVDLVAPWGEYYARNQRTIPPYLYADMAVQSGISFDAFGLQFFFGSGVDGMFTRDMFQISSLLDAFAKLGKPLHVTAIQVPSATAKSSGGSDGNGGHWHEPWSESIQAEWVSSLMKVALSKPFVETVAWRGLCDDSKSAVPSGGLLRADLKPKPAYHQFIKSRSFVRGERRTGRVSAK